jgi:cytochrome c oxidase subunit 2
VTAVARSTIAAAAAVGLAASLACSGPQSALDTAGRDAEAIARLWWWMAGGAALIWAGVGALILYAAWARPAREHDARRSYRLIVGGGAVFPVVVLAALLTYGLVLMPGLRPPPVDPGSPRVVVTGEQWWWRVRYLPPGGDGPPDDAELAAAVELANELWLPVGERTEILLDSPDVIHSFWVPPLAGKVDMIPGRVTRLVVEPTRTGVFRGACAELCGASHAWMAFDVVVVEPAAYAAWLARQARPAAPPADPLAARGGELFVTHGCGACHTVRGTAAAGVVGPDLTHAGGRRSLAAGTLPNTAPAFRRWLASSEAIKPEVHMPAFGMLPPADLDALATYLEGLE